VLTGPGVVRMDGGRGRSLDVEADQAGMQEEDKLNSERRC